MSGLSFLLLLLEGGYSLFGRNKTNKVDLLGGSNVSQFSGNE